MINLVGIILQIFVFRVITASKTAVDDLPATIHPPTYNNGVRNGDSTKDPICRSEACVTRAALLLQSMNATADPCEDFFDYACGNWITLNPIPPDYARWGVLQQMQQNLFAKLRDLLDTNASDTSSARRKARQVYAACMNLTAIEEAGSKDFQRMQRKAVGPWPILDSDWHEEDFNFLHAYANLSREGLAYLISLYVGGDQDNPRENILFLDETSLGLPSKKMYYKASAEKTRRAYLALMKNLTVLYAEDLGLPVPADLNERIMKIFDFEARIANITYTEEERRDPYKTLHKMALGEFLDKHFNRTFAKHEFLSTLKGIPRNSSVSNAISLNMTVNVVNPSYYGHLDEILSTYLETTDGKRFLAGYLGWRYLLNAAGQLSKRYRDAAFEFDKAYTGVREEAPRWRTCVDYTNAAMKLAVGSIYVESYFGMEAKAKLLSLVNDVKTAFEEILKEVDWMDAETRVKALAKLREMTEYIGYPNFLLTDLPRLDRIYEKYNMSSIHFVNDKNIDIQMTARGHEELIKPSLRNIDEKSSPATVNAYYYPQKNVIAFLAGIIQPPIFHKDYPEYLNYGSLGQVFGHEMTHGFDDKGSLYDAKGRLSTWWTNTSRAKYMERAQSIIDQYASYNTSAGKMNGNLTSGENIADNGGVKEAYMAFKAYLSRLNGSAPHLLPGLENMPIERAYFIAGAQTWCGYVRPEYLTNNILLAVHSPYRFRVNGPLANLPEFSAAFQCPAGSPMNPVNRAGVW